MMSPADRATLPDMPVANVEDGVAPPWRCQACVQNDKYAVQRVVDVMRAENGQIYLLMEYLGYQYLEARPESWPEDKKGELRLAFKRMLLFDRTRTCFTAGGLSSRPCGRAHRLDTPCIAPQKCAGCSSPPAAVVAAVEYRVAHRAAGILVECGEAPC